jgi:hypothetical protein
MKHNQRKTFKGKVLNEATGEDVSGRKNSYR